MSLSLPILVIFDRAGRFLRDRAAARRDRRAMEKLPPRLRRDIGCSDEGSPARQFLDGVWR